MLAPNPNPNPNPNSNPNPNPNPNPEHLDIPPRVLAPNPSPSSHPSPYPYTSPNRNLASGGSRRDKSNAAFLPAPAPTTAAAWSAQLQPVALWLQRLGTLCLTPHDVLWCARGACREAAALLNRARGWDGSSPTHNPNPNPSPGPDSNPNPSPGPDYYTGADDMLPVLILAVHQAGMEVAAGVGVGEGQAGSERGTNGGLGLGGRGGFRPLAALAYARTFLLERERGAGAALRGVKDSPDAIPLGFDLSEATADCRDPNSPRVLPSDVYLHTLLYR